MLIISMMIDDVKVYCGKYCTSFIINDAVYICNTYNLIPTKQIFSERIGEICHGADYKIFLSKSKKEIYCRGKNDNGQLGLGDYKYYATPQKNIFDFKSKITSVGCGHEHTMIVTEFGGMYGWGLNNTGQLGLGDGINRNVPTKLLISNVKSVSCGSGHTMILTSDGCGYACGENGRGQLGLGHQWNRSLPHKLNLSDMISISCGASHTATLTFGGILYSWGSNFSGQLGLGDQVDYSSPQKIDLANLCVVSVSCGSLHTMILTSKGELFGCGDNSCGQLSVYDKEISSNVYMSSGTLLKFQKVNFLNEIILSVDCGGFHTIVTTKSRKCYGCGINKSRQLGLGDTMNRSELTEIVFKI